MNIDKMEAGREMDALVWLALNGESIENGTSGCRYVDGDVQPHAGYPIGHVSPAHYSTSIAAAWEVVEKLRGEPRETKEAFVCDLTSQRDKWSDENDQTIREWLMFNVLRWMLWEANAPLAICRAALRAVKDA